MFFYKVILDVSQHTAEIGLMQAVFKTAIFLITIGIGGYMLVMFRRHGFLGISKSNEKISCKERIKIVDTKMLGSGKYLSIIEYSGKKVMVAINKSEIRKICDIDNFERKNFKRNEPNKQNEYNR